MKRVITMNNKRVYRLVLFFLPFYLFTFLPLKAQTSVAGLFPLTNSGRLVWNFNAGWRFYLGDVAGAEAKDFNDKGWEIVSTPHSVQLMPAEASGCRNYQGIAWYRKHFVLPKECAGRDVTLYFEAIMGKQTIYVNGQKVKDHEGGYLHIRIGFYAASYYTAHMSVCSGHYHINHQSINPTFLIEASSLSSFSGSIVYSGALT